MKKIIAMIAVISMIMGITASVNAAVLPANTLSVDVSGDNITVNATGKDFSADNVSALTIYDNGAAVANIDVADVTANNNGDFVFSVAADATGSFAVAQNKTYAIEFATVGGDTGIASYVTDRTVNVTANVLPILSMALANTSIDFSDLVVDTAKTAGSATTITVNTNADNGYSVQVSNLGLIDVTDPANSIADAAANTDLTDGNSYGYGINATIDNAGDNDFGSLVSADGTIQGNFNGTDDTKVTGMSTTDAELVSANGPVSGQVTTVSYYSKISALQTAGNYSDTITYTLTGKF